jgi:hypothetical protein
MVKKLSEAEKSAHVTGKYSIKNAIIGGIFLVVVVIITWWLNKPDNKGKESQVQKVEKQTADSGGSISNYNAGRDVKIENVSYNTVVPKDLSTVKEKQNIQSPVIIYKDRPQQKKENPKDFSKNIIINNAPNQGIQINEVKGDIYLKDPEPPIELEIVRILNSINPVILQSYKTAVNPICVMISDEKASQLFKIKDKLKKGELLQFKSNGSVNFGIGNQMGDCINDVDEGSLKGFILFFLKNFKTIKLS